MKELFLKFKDESGEEKRSPVEGERVVVGRHSAADVCIPDGRLSREHLKIERYGDIFVAYDAGSSNGTKLNDEPLKQPVALSNGDIIDLGGLKVTVEIESDEPQAEAAGPTALPEAQPVGGVGFGASASGSSANSSSTLLLIMIPAFGLIFLLFAGGIIFMLMSSSNTTVAKKQDDFVYSDDPDNNVDKPSNKKDPGSGTNSKSSGTDLPSNSSSNDNLPVGNTLSSGKTGENAKIEQHGAAFLRRIAQNDPKAFLTSEQAQRLSGKVKQFSGSSAVADNLNSARKNSSQIKSIAESKNLKPQFLAIAAVARLGSSRGDVVQTAQGMAEVLDKLGNQLGNELADDSLLVIASYGQGSAGDFMKMRNMLQDLSNKFPESSRAIRTIWFLQKNNKISQSEFDNALNFLAIGTISQNPKEFGINAEALTL